MVVLLVRELAAQIGGEVRGDGERPIAGVSTPEAAGPTDLVVIVAAADAGVLERSRAAAAIVPRGIAVPTPIVGIETDHPALAMARAVDLLSPPVRTWRAVSPQAVVAAGAFVAEGAGIAPFAVVCEGARVGRHVEIHPGVLVGPGSQVGDGSILHPGVRLGPGTIVGHRVVLQAGAAVGVDGFTYVPEPSGPGAPAGGPRRYRKHRPLGRVVIDDDVEVGANTTIARASVTETLIGRGTKIGHLTVIGADCRIGQHCLIADAVSVPRGTLLDDYGTLPPPAASPAGRGPSDRERQALPDRPPVSSPIPARGTVMRRLLAGARRLLVPERETGH